MPYRHPSPPKGTNLSQQGHGPVRDGILLPEALVNLMDELGLALAGALCIS